MKTKLLPVLLFTILSLIGHGSLCSQTGINMIGKNPNFTLTGYAVLYDMSNCNKGKFWNVNLTLVPQDKGIKIKKLLIDDVNIPNSGPNKYTTPAYRSSASYSVGKLVIIKVVYTSKMPNPFVEKTEKLASIHLNYLIKYVCPVANQTLDFTLTGVKLTWKFLKNTNKSKLYIYNRENPNAGAVIVASTANTTYTIPANVIVRNNRYRVRNSVFYGMMNKTGALTNNSNVEFSYDYLLDFAIN